MSVKQPKTTVKQHFWGSQIAFHFFIEHVLMYYSVFLHPGQPLTPVALMPLKLCRKLQD